MNTSFSQDHQDQNFSKQLQSFPHTKTIGTNNSQPSFANSYQHLIYQNKIQILQDRLRCYQQQVQNLKKTNSILLNKISSISSIQHQLESQCNKNLQLRSQIQKYRQRLEQSNEEYESKVKQIKQQLETKQKFIELMKQENQKNMIKKQWQVNYLKDVLREKIFKLEEYQKKMHSIEIQRFNNEDNYDCYSGERYQRESIWSKKSSTIGSSKYNSTNPRYSNNSQNINTINIIEKENQKQKSIQQKALQLIKIDPSQLKVMMRSINNAQKCLQMGGQEISMIGNQKQRSMLGSSTMMAKSKINKTYYK